GEVPTLTHKELPAVRAEARFPTFRAVSLAPSRRSPSAYPLLRQAPQVPVFKDETKTPAFRPQGGSPLPQALKTVTKHVEASLPIIRFKSPPPQRRFIPLVPSEIISLKGEPYSPSDLPTLVGDKGSSAQRSVPASPVLVPESPKEGNS
ncbi:MAG: hypothetical protein LBF22_13910, partial [Deltaproteobacteria bacterium]|nr:hypothetical protein [Deltaproteobacteria bacterium]